MGELAQLAWLGYRMEVVLDVVHFNVRDRNNLHNKTLGAFLLCYHLRGGIDAEGEGEGEGKYRAVRSKDSKLFNGASFRCPLTADQSPLQGVKLQLYAVNGIEIVDIGSCKWRPES